jgi:eukaryotic-like serine/threonine-protein kinase
VNWEIGSIFAEEYVIERLIGRGNLGPVYEARDMVLGRRVAIRVLEPGYNHERLSAFDENEAKSAERLGNTHIARLLSVGTLPNGERFTITEYVEGEALRSRMDRLSCISETGALEVLVQLLRALAAAHGSGIIHRDLTPRSIFIVPAQAGTGDTIRLIDFGITRLQLVSASPELSAALRHTDVDSYQYLAPEQLSGLRELDPRSNVFSLGVIAYEVVTGCLPFQGRNIGELAMNMLQVEPRPVEQLAPQTSPQLAKLIRKALATTPSARYHGAEEMLSTIAAFASLPSVFPPEADTKAQTSERLDASESPGPPPASPTLGAQAQDSQDEQCDCVSPPPTVPTGLALASSVPGETPPAIAQSDQPEHVGDSPEEQQEAVSPPASAPTGPTLPIPAATSVPPPAQTEPRARTECVIEEPPPVAQARRSARPECVIEEPPPVAQARRSVRAEPIAPSEADERPDLAGQALRRTRSPRVGASARPGALPAQCLRTGMEATGSQDATVHGRASLPRSRKLAVVAIVLIWVAIAAIVYSALPRRRAASPNPATGATERVIVTPASGSFSSTTPALTAFTPSSPRIVPSLEFAQPQGRTAPPAVSTSSPSPAPASARPVSRSSRPTTPPHSKTQRETTASPSKQPATRKRELAKDHR